MTHDTEACNISRAVALVLAKELGCVCIQSRHRFHSHEVRVVDMLSLDPSLFEEGLTISTRQLLFHVYGRLRAQGLR